MRNVLVLGANGQIARLAVPMLAEQDVALTLLARRAPDQQGAGSAARVIEADVLDRDQLRAALHGQEIVYANLAGEIDRQAEAVVTAMQAEGVSRLIFVTSLGIYDEVPGAFGEWNRQQIGSALTTYRAAADTIEGSSLNYTILRPAWLTDVDEVDYEITHRDESFKGTEVSRKSVAAAVAQIAAEPTRWERDSIGIDKPGSDGDRPRFL